MTRLKLLRAGMRLLAALLAVIGFLSVGGAYVALYHALRGDRGAWVILGVSVAVAAAAFWASRRLWDGPTSVGAATGHVVLFECPMANAVSTTPALTIRGARDAVERFIPLTEFGPLFGGYALWAPPADPIPELPGEALGVWSRRTCQRLRRILRERGAVVEVRRERGPAQRVARLVTLPSDRPRGDARAQGKT